MNKKMRKLQIKFALATGFPNWDRITPGQFLLSEFAKISDSSNVLLLGCSHGALAVFLSRQIHNGQILLSDTNTIALSTTKETLKINNITNAEIISDITLSSKYSKKFDTIIADIELSKGRGFSRRWLIEAYEALKIKGQLYIAGAKSHGVKSAIKDAEELFGNMEVLGYKKGSRVARALKKSGKRKHVYWDEKAGIALGTWNKIEAELHGKPFCFYSLPGVFSYEEIDEGTKRLLGNIGDFENARVLDWGCGYGAIGIFLAKFGAASVDMMDVDTFALASARKNVDANKTHNTKVFSANNSNLVKEKAYDLIISNPPFHIGKDVNYQTTISFIQRAKQALNPGGRLVVVTNRFIPYEKQMRKLFKRVRHIFEDSKYKVIEAS